MNLTRFFKHQISLIVLLTVVSLHAQIHMDIVVDQNGEGDYKTVTEAINALPMYPYQRTVIFIKNGIYNEKIRIEQNYITLKGESRDSTIIRYDQLREDWNKNKDYIGPAVVNLEGDDIILDNLTIENSQPEIGPHAFAIYGLNINRTVIINCNVLSKGGDTVSLWNYKQGMYYHANCTFMGAVDFVCPRGWCFIRNSKFYEVKETAALWHAGNYSADQKFVIVNSDFDGVPDFQLGRHHYEAAFYLIDCHFSKNMADKPIYKVYANNPQRDNPYYHGERTYYYNCSKEGKTFEWYQNNFEMSNTKISPQQIMPSWTFADRWDPESESPLKVTEYRISDKQLTLSFEEIVTVRGEPEFVNGNGKKFSIVPRRFNDISRLTFESTTAIEPADLDGDFNLVAGDIISSIAGVYDRSVGRVFRIAGE